MNAWYQAVQFRDGPTSTVESWVALLNNGGATPTEVQNAIVADTFTSSYVNPMIRIYQAAFNRVPDSAGQNFWVDNYAAGNVTTQTAADNFANSPEFKATYGNASAADPINAAVLTAFYQNVLGRAPDQAGYDFWLNSGQNIGQVLNYFAQSPEFTVRAADPISQFQHAEIAGNAATSGSLFDNYPPINPVSHILTTNVDIITAEANTTVVGTQDVPGTGTYSDGDNITGAASTTLQVTLTGAYQPTTTVNGIGKLKLTSSTAGGVFDYSANANNSIVSIENSRSAQSLTVNNIGNANQAFAVTGVTGAAAVATNFNFNAGVLNGAADKASLALNGVGNVNLPGTHFININGGAPSQGYEELSINTTGAASRLAGLNATDAFLAATLEKVTITGDQNLRIDGALRYSANATKGVLDASTMTGKLDVNLDNGVAMTVTGGKGDDTFRFGASLTGADSVDGGDGFDILGADTTGAFSAAFAAGNIKNIEGLQIQAAPVANSTLDVSKVGDVTLVEFANGSGGVGVTTTLNNLADGAKIAIDATGFGTVAANIKDATQAGTNNTLNIDLGTATDVFAINGGTVTAAGVENINIATLGTGGQAAINNLTITGSASLKNVVVTGNEGLQLNTGAPSAITNYDASKSTGVQDTTLISNNGGFSNGGAAITGGNRADTLWGGAGADNIVGGLGNDQLFGSTDSAADTLTGGDGQDTFLLWDNNNAFNSSAATTVSDVIGDMQLGSGGDVIDLTQNPNWLLPVQNGIISSVKITSLNASLPAAAINPTDAGRAELIILDSNVAALQANSPQAVNNLLFNLAGSGAYTQVLIAYASSATADAQLALATIAGGDITNIEQVGTLKGITTDALASGFNQSNLVGVQNSGNLLLVNAAPFNTVTGAGITGGVTATAQNDLIVATVAQATNAGDVIDGLGGVNTLNLSDAGVGGENLNAAATFANISNINLQAGAAGLTINNLAGLNINNATAAAATVTLGTGAFQWYNGNTVVDTVTLGGANQTANLVGGGGDIVSTSIANSQGSDVFFGPGAGDVLNVTTAGAVTIRSSALAATDMVVTGAETINLTGASNLTLTQDQALTVVTGAAATTVTANGVGTVTVGQAAGQALTLGGTSDFIVAGGTTGAITSTTTGTLTVTSSANSQTISSASATTVNAAALGGNTVTMDGTGNFLINGAGTAGTDVFTELATHTGGYTINAVAANAITVTEAATSAAGAGVINLTTNDVTLTANGFHSSTTVNLTGAASDVLGATSTGAVTVNATGAGTHSITTGAGADVVSATAAVGANALTIVTNAGNDTISLANSGGNAITGGSGIDTITGGTAIDTFNYLTSASSVGAAGSNVDVITNLLTGADVISLHGNGTGAGTGVLAGIDATAAGTTGKVAIANITIGTAVNSIGDVYTALATQLTAAGGGGTTAFAGSTAAGGAASLTNIVVSFIGGGTFAGDYLVVNDVTGGFQQATDFVVNVTGINGGAGSWLGGASLVGGA